MLNAQGDVMIDYTNWRGERRMRRIQPLQLLFESSEHHQDKQWLLEAIDRETEGHRAFAMANIHSWRQINPT